MTKKEYNNYIKEIKLVLDSLGFTLNDTDNPYSGQYQYIYKKGNNDRYVVLKLEENDGEYSHSKVFSIFARYSFTPDGHINSKENFCVFKKDFTIPLVTSYLQMLIKII